MRTNECIVPEEIMNNFEVFCLYPSFHERGIIYDRELSMCPWSLRFDKQEQIVWVYVYARRM